MEDGLLVSIPGIPVIREEINCQAGFQDALCFEQWKSGKSGKSGDD